MAGELDAAIAEIQSLLKQIPGLKSAPSQPTENASAYPFLIVFADSGTWEKESASQVKGIHTITVEIHVSRKDLPRDIERVLPFGELVKDKLFADANATLGGTVDNIVDEVDYTFGPIGYGGVLTIGWQINIPVKIRSKESAGVFRKG